MMKENQNYPRGAEWRQWDLHIHTPASFHWSGKRFEKNVDSEINRMLVDEMIAALNAAEPAVFALMDYWTFDGWFALQKRVKEDGAPTLEKRVFPGIELRLAAPTNCRLNAHVLFSDEIDDQILHDFRAALLVEIIDRPLSDAALIALARAVGEDKLKHHSFKKGEIDVDSEKALIAGSTIAEINCESYKAAIAKVPNGQAIGFMPYDTSDGLSEVKWHEHYAYFLGLFKTSPIFETRNSDLRGAFVGEETAGNKKWIENFQVGLDNVPRLAVSGSDAHCFVGVKGNNDKRGYGDFPSSKVTWIKADPTFLGLLQAIKEPAKRSFIGKRPDKLREIEENKGFFLDCVEIGKNAGSTILDEWLNNCKVLLNSDLVAIIGNKGSGKSALADVIALLGNSLQKAHFSFLKKDRFRGKSGEPAKHFTGKITWLDASFGERKLSEDTPDDKVELVRYIPQGHFEELCNAHVTGRSNAFETELRSVIFSHTSDAIRLGALDFDQLITQQESSYRDQLGEYRKDLKKLNQEIENIETQLHPDLKKSLEEQHAIKLKQIDEHNKIKPDVGLKPSDQLSPEQQAASVTLDGIASQLKIIDELALANISVEAGLAAKQKAIQTVRDRLRLLDRQYKAFCDDVEKDLILLDLTVPQLVNLTSNSKPLDDLVSVIHQEQQTVSNASNKNSKEKERLIDELSALNTKLNEPQRLYQEKLKKLDLWQERFRELTGTSDAPETLKGIEARIEQLDNLPKLLIRNQEKRFQLSGEIFGILDGQRKAREALFQPVQDLILNNSLIRDEYKLQFQATLGGTSDAIASPLFDLIKRQSGIFRGEDESYAAVRKIYEQYDLSQKDGALKFVSSLNKEIGVAAVGANKEAVGIAAILKKDRSASDVYDLLFGLSFLEPRYSLLFQDAQIEQLSPGQRGALLLIFYLLVDKGRNPIILDQPEENLDNETVVSLLVPVLSEAKKKRQIIMVTHNPNLAVVCDAEQIIHSCFDRKKASTITYVAGSIENPMINAHVVTVLEGTKPAFNNRRVKYH